MNIPSPSFYRIRFTTAALLQSAVNSAGLTVKEAVTSGKIGGVFTCKMVRGQWANDSMLKTLGQELLLRRDLANVVRDQLRLPDGLWWHDATVVSNTGQPIGDFRLVDPNRIEYDIADRESSDLEIVLGAVLQVRTLVVNRSKIPEFDLFPMMPVDWIATEKAKQLLLSANASGIAFEELSVAEPK